MITTPMEGGANKGEGWMKTMIIVLEPINYYLTYFES